jgi:hypothetical protein
MSQALELEIQRVAENYLHFTFNGSPTISIPYANNKSKKRIAGLRAYTGKGSVEDICYELNALSFNTKIDYSAMSAEEFKKFLVEHGLGIDCSGLIYHILDKLCQERNLGKLASNLIFPRKASVIRRIIRKIRPAENTDVLTFTSEANSFSITADKAEAGDIIVFIDDNIKENHIALITSVHITNGKINIEYIHSIALEEDGSWNHGVRKGKLQIHNGQSVDKAVWLKEDGQTPDESMQKKAQKLYISIKRMRFLSKKDK